MQRLFRITKSASPRSQPNPSALIAFLHCSKKVALASSAADTLGQDEVKKASSQKVIQLGHKEKGNGENGGDVPAL